MTSENRIQFEQKGALAVIRLNRPEARNALSPDMVCGKPGRRAGHSAHHDGDDADTRMLQTAGLETLATAFWPLAAADAASRLRGYNEG